MQPLPDALPQTIARAPGSSGLEASSAEEAEFEGSADEPLDLTESAALHAISAEEATKRTILRLFNRIVYCGVFYRDLSDGLVQKVAQVLGIRGRVAATSEDELGALAMDLLVCYLEGHAFDAGSGPLRFLPLILFELEKKGHKFEAFQAESVSLFTDGDCMWPRGRPGALTGTLLVTLLVATAACQNPLLHSIDSLEDVIALYVVGE